MKFAIIAAGEGARLVSEGVVTPKPIVSIDGEPMIDRLVRIFAANQASSVSVIVNEEMLEVHEHLLHTTWPVPLHILRQSTPSSMHSFYALASSLGDERFCLTTVDTIFREDEFAEYISAFLHCQADGLFAVTDFVDDESPLFVETDETMTIRGFHDEMSPNAHFVSGGIYCLKASSIAVLKSSIEAGMSRMRNFQRQLVKNGLQIQAWPFSKIIDVDHTGDIRQAERFLKGI